MIFMTRLDEAYALHYWGMALSNSLFKYYLLCFYGLTELTMNLCSEDLYILFSWEFASDYPQDLMFWLTFTDDIFYLTIVTHAQWLVFTQFSLNDILTLLNSLSYFKQFLFVTFVVPHFKQAANFIPTFPGIWASCFQLSLRGPTRSSWSASCVYKAHVSH